MRLWKLGNDAGFNSYIEYEVPNLLQDGVNRFISVVWKQGPEIKAAFQIRRKKRGMDQLRNLRDINNLSMLPATEKYLVNISQKTGDQLFSESLTPAASVSFQRNSFSSNWINPLALMESG